MVKTAEFAPQDHRPVPVDTLAEVEQVDQQGYNMVLADCTMALAGPQGSLGWAVPVGHTNSQVGPQVGPVSCKPGCMVNLEHIDKPQEQEGAKPPHARQTDLGTYTRECHPVHSAKRRIGKDLGELVQLRRSAVAKTTDTPPERYSPV